MSLRYKVRRIKTKEHAVHPITKSLFEGINNIRRNETQVKFKEWLNSGIYLNDYDEMEYITNKDRINDFNDSIISIIKNNGFVIKNEKELKNELASFIYKLS